MLVVFLFALAMPRGAAVSDEDIRTLNQPEVSDRGGGPGGSLERPGMGIAFAKMMGALVLVLGAILGTAWLAKRYLPAAGAGSPGKGDAIRVLATRMLGNRRSLVLVRVRGQTLLLGVTAQSINTLTEIHEVEGEWAQPAGAENTGTPSAFDRRLGRMIDQAVRDDAETPEA